ncbi:MAG: S41 family peptidase, partial [Chloroflexi bacterium]|nr:S41 family peptidase [Chloroflexota bacterium]
AIGGMTDALGDTGHSRFLTPDMVKQESNFDQGQFEGIGAEIGSQDSHIVIVITFENSPAQRAGLHAGDILLKVDGMDVTGLTPSEVVTHVLGPAGTYVTLTIADPSKGSVAQDVTIVRAKIALENLTWQQLPGTTIAHVKLAAFSNGVTEELKKDLNDIKAQHLTGIVLDLRNDPGGLLDEAIGVTSQFLSSGNVLEEKDSRGQVVKVGVKSGGEAPDIPLVVLVDNGTASAAEIVGGALQDAHRAKLYGEITFGTGTVLNQYGLADGSALLLATEEWLTPNGRVIWHKGIAPDVQVALPAGVSPLDPLGERSMTSAQLQASGDAQLLQALDSLIQSAHKP